MTHRQQLIHLPPNRVWRTYPGGRTLDTLAGAPQPADTHLAEDWIASTTRAVNPGREHLREGISQVRVGDDPTPRDFAELLATDPEYFLGAAHVARYGAQPQVLVKFLDSGTRLHFQVHPTREFAQRVLGLPSGKTEAYHVLAVREPRSPAGVAGGAGRGIAALEPSLGTRHSAHEAAGCIYAGFQRPPSRAGLREHILRQDVAAIESCFDPIEVRPGDTFIIPGGTPHALGAGVFMVEIQEPSDLVVRFEFERAGYVLPGAARFMGRDLELALDVFNLSPLTAADVDRRVRCRPRRLRELGRGSWQEELIGPARTDCFRVAKTHLAGPVLKDESSSVIAIVTAGSVTAQAGGQAHLLRTYDKVFLPAGLGPVHLVPHPHAEILECFPPQ
jgi:mannose-6-phosphate isomerase